MLIQRIHPKIPKALFNAPEEYLQQRLQDKYGYPNSKKTYSENSFSQAAELALLKYYPKYCCTIRLDNKPKPHPILHRIKQIKTLNHFEYDLGPTDKNKTIKLLKKLLVNKRKSLKSLPVIGFEERRSHIYQILIMEMCSFFPRIQTLNLYLPSSQASYYADLRSISWALEEEVLESYGRFWDFLKQLKHLKISNALPNFSVIIPYLQRSKRFLSSLQSFQLTIEPNCQRSLNHTIEFFETVLKSPYLLDFLTHVDFHRFKTQEQHWMFFRHMSQQDYWNQIKSIIDRCSKLESVAIYNEERLSNLWEQLADSLKCPNSLNALNLRFSDMRSLIEGFNFPVQLRKLKLHLENLSHTFNSTNLPKKTIYLWNENEEKSPTLISKFIEKFNNLTHLDSLELNMDLFTDPNDILKTFTIPLLQQTTKLEEFEWNFSQGFEKKDNFLDLSIFLEGLNPLEELKDFKISRPVLDEMRLINCHGLFITFPPHRIFSFPNISSISIDARISEDFDFQTFFEAFSEGSRKKKISLGKIHVKSIRHFIRLIKILKEAEQFQRLKIYLEITLCVESWEEIERNFQETIIPAKNVFINLKIYVSSLDKTNFMEVGVRALERIFRQMKFGLTWLAKEKDIVSGYEKTVCILLIKNNYQLFNSFFN